jgi:hypothetical protein
MLAMMAGLICLLADYSCDAGGLCWLNRHVSYGGCMTMLAGWIDWLCTLASYGVYDAFLAMMALQNGSLYMLAFLAMLVGCLAGYAV